MTYQKPKPLQATTDKEPLLFECFNLEGNFSEVYLYAQEIMIVQKDKTRVIPIRLGLSFGILKDQNDVTYGLELSYADQRIKFKRDFWPKAAEWEDELLNHLARSNFHSFFRAIRRLGKGGFASVYLAEDVTTNRQTAVKAFTKNIFNKPQSYASLQNQIKILRQLKHPNLIEFYGAYASDNSFYLSLEYAQGLTLQNFIRKFKIVTSEQRCKIMKGLLKGLQYLSRLKILHRDLKPQNIVISLDCQTVKILDFGLATHIDQKNYIFVCCGSPGYVAPQILKIREPKKARLGIESDMFSLGAIYYHMIYGSPLFKGKNHEEILLLNRSAKVTLPQNGNLEKGELQLLKGMLQQNPSARITPSRALRSYFFKDQNFKGKGISEYIQQEEQKINTSIYLY